MKKSLRLLSGILFLSACAEAQIQKGTFLLGGGLSAFSTETTTGSAEQKTKGLGFSPSVGHAIRENMVFGLTGFFASSRGESGNAEYVQKGRAYGGGLFLRRYLPLGSKFYFFGEGNMGYQYQKTRNTGPLNSYVRSTQKTIYVSLFPGVAFAVNRRFHLEASINQLLGIAYTEGKINQLDNGTFYHVYNKNFSFQANASNSTPVQLGFRLTIGK